MVKSLKSAINCNMHNYSLILLTVQIFIICEYNDNNFKTDKIINKHNV